MKKITLLIAMITFSFAYSQSIAGGYEYTLFTCGNGTATATGDNSAGQLGNGTTTNTLTPIAISGLTIVIAVSTKDAFSLFLKSDGTVWACGTNSFGQLGNGTTTNTKIPAKIAVLTGILVKI